MTESYGSGSGTTHAYAVEVRTTNAVMGPDIHPLGFIIGTEWRRVPVHVAKCDRTDHNHYQSGKIGEIPVWNFCHEADNLDLMNFNAAYTLSCQIQAQEWNGGCTQCRIVEVEIVYSYGTRAVKTSEPISLFELRRTVKFEPLPSAPSGEPERKV